jgi:hypothetical protein
VPILSLPAGYSPPLQIVVCIIDMAQRRRYSVPFSAWRLKCLQLESRVKYTAILYMIHGPSGNSVLCFLYFNARSIYGVSDNTESVDITAGDQ